MLDEHRQRGLPLVGRLSYRVMPGNHAVAIEQWRRHDGCAGQHVLPELDWRLCPREGRVSDRTAADRDLVHEWVVVKLSDRQADDPVQVDVLAVDDVRLMAGYHEPHVRVAPSDPGPRLGHRHEIRVRTSPASPANR